MQINQVRQSLVQESEVCTIGSICTDIKLPLTINTVAPHYTEALLRWNQGQSCTKLQECVQLKRLAWLLQPALQGDWVGGLEVVRLPDNSVAHLEMGQPHGGAAIALSKHGDLEHELGLNRGTVAEDYLI